MWLITLTRQRRSQSSSSRSGGPPGGPVMPAFEKNASIGATLSARSTNASSASSLPTSVCTASPPTCSAVTCAPSRFRSATVTRAPSSAKRSAQARPMPLAPPVTTMCRPARSMAPDPTVLGMETREIRLARRPHGEPVDDDFELAVRELDEPGEGQVLVRNRFMSVDPYMRGRMNDRKSYVPPFELGKALQGGAVGELEDGSLVLHQRGWREHALLPRDQVRRVG